MRGAATAVQHTAEEYARRLSAIGFELSYSAGMDYNEFVDAFDKWRRGSTPLTTAQALDFCKKEYGAKGLFPWQA
jgi:hypothetical protein